VTYDNRNKGALFKNDRKEGIETNPDYNGELDVGGEKFWLNAWIRTSKAGAKYMSLSVKPKTDAVVREQPRQRRDVDPLN